MPTTRSARPSANCTTSAATPWSATSRLQPVIDGVEGTFAKAPSTDPQRGEVLGNVPGQAAHRRHSAPQRMARGQGRPARPRRQAGRRHHRSRGNRNRVRRNIASPIRYRNRPRNHQLRAGLRRDPRRMPTRSRRANVQLLAVPQLVNPGEVRERPCCPRSSMFPARRFSGGRQALPWDEKPQLRGRPPGAEARRRERRPSGLLGQVVALALRRGSHSRRCCLSARPKASRSSRRWRPSAQLPGAPARCLEREDAGCAVCRTAGAGHGAGILRRGGARTHARRPPSRPATRTSRCSKSRRPRSTPGSNGTPTGASASGSAT